MTISHPNSRRRGGRAAATALSGVLCFALAPALAAAERDGERGGSGSGAPGAEAAEDVEHPGSHEGGAADGAGEAVDGERDREDFAGLPKPSGEIRVEAPALGKEAEVELFDEEGELDDEALAELDEVFQCRRSGEKRAVRPELLVLLSHIYDRFDGEKVELVSGFREQQNEGSRHYHASAMDLRVDDVSVRELAEFAETLDTEEGPNLGIGRYPRSGFVHVDIRAPGEPSYRWVQVGNRHRALGIPDS